VADPLILRYFIYSSVPLWQLSEKGILFPMVTLVFISKLHRKPKGQIPCIDIDPYFQFNEKCLSDNKSF